jgi:hypothetical protein
MTSHLWKGGSARTESVPALRQCCSGPSSNRAGLGERHQWDERCDVRSFPKIGCVVGVGLRPTPTATIHILSCPAWFPLPGRPGGSSLRLPIFGMERMFVYDDTTGGEKCHLII